MPMQGSFDATQFAPKQIGDTHPTGKFPATITNTSIEPTKDNVNRVPGCENDGMFIVEFTTPAGTIAMRYNLWNKVAKAVEIAQGQLAALCHAIGVYKLDFLNDGAVLRGSRCQIDVADQLDNERKPNGYTQIKKVYDPNGNEPGKPPTQQQPAQQGFNAPTQQNAPMTQQPNGGWGQSGPTQQPGPGPAQQTAVGPSNWGASNTGAAQNNAPPPNVNNGPAPQTGGWQQNQAPQQGNQGGPPPWSR